MLNARDYTRPTMYYRIGMPTAFGKPVLKPKFWDGFETGLKILKPGLLQYKMNNDQKIPKGIL